MPRPQWATELRSASNHDAGDARASVSCAAFGCGMAGWGVGCWACWISASASGRLLFRTVVRPHFDLPAAASGSVERCAACTQSFAEDYFGCLKTAARDRIGSGGQVVRHLLRYRS
jgi:hypothetical protein